MRVKKIQLITMGCSKNRVDSEYLLYQLYNNRVEIIEDGESLEGRECDAILINTCGFIKDAKEESIEMILNAVELKKSGYAKALYVFGCLSQRYRKELAEVIPEVDRFFGVLERESVLAALGYNWSSAHDVNRLLTTPNHYSYLKVSEGCDRFCSYCAIPLIRGSHISLPMEQLVEEAHLMAQLGVKELNLIAQDTTYYGLDLYGERRIAQLIEKLSEVDGIEWIRVLYTYPASFPEELIEVIASNPKVCNYLDIPLQHINDQVLKSMRRDIDGDGIRRLVEKFRNSIPNLALRTTMIVGHPGESREAFEELKSFIVESRFERLGAFTYSEEEGTWGAANLMSLLSEEEMEERLGELLELQAKISLEENLKRVGSRERVLVDWREGNLLGARSIWEAPEVDGEILITIPDGATLAEGVGSDMEESDIIGTFVDVEIVDGECYDLFAKLVK